LLEAVVRQRNSAGQRDRASPPSGQAAVPPGAEEQLVYIGLNYPAWRERIAQALVPDDLRDPVLRRIFVEFVQGETAAESSKSPRPMSLQPPEMQRRLSSLWARDPWSHFAEAPEGSQAGEEDQEALRRTVEDCLARIRQGRAAAERQALRQALEAADRRGDGEQLLRLLAEHPSVKRSRDTQ